MTSIQLMKLFRLKTLIVATCLIASNHSTSAQNFSFNCSRDTLVPGCPTNLCINLKAIVPDIHGLTTSYSLNPGSFTAGCFPVYVAPDDPNGTPTNLIIDDRYSGVINLSFNFPFFSSNAARGARKSRGFARPFAPIGPKPGIRNGSP